MVWAHALPEAASALAAPNILRAPRREIDIVALVMISPRDQGPAQGRIAFTSRNWGQACRPVARASGGLRTI